MIGFDKIFLSYLNNADELFFIGISGSAGLGKSTYCKNLGNEFLKKGIPTTYLPLDGFLLPREDRHKKNTCGYNPDASSIESILSTIEKIKNNNEVEIPLYNHSNGSIDNYIKIKTNPIIIVDGNMCIFHPIRSRYINYHIFFDSTEEIKKKLRFEVDFKERGYNYGKAISIYDKEQKDFNKYIESQKKLSQLCIFVDDDRNLRIHC